MSGGRYTFEREIGRGASGPVWCGHDTVLGRQVALKRVGVHPGGSSPDEEHGAREARLAASLNHPHVVGVLDLTVIGDEHWLVMEYVEGSTLAQKVRDEGPLAPAEAARLLAQVAEALAAAHRAGIVHRDVKPSNVLVTTDGTAKLTDFGIARGADDPSLTRTGMVTGSPAYLAPEVATGSSATPASDVWSLGATLYHVLAGRPPYHEGDNVLSTMYRIVHEQPPRLPELGRLNVVLERTMATGPEHRWTMAQVHQALTHLSGQASAPVRPGLVATHSAPARRESPAATTRTNAVPTADPAPTAEPSGGRTAWKVAAVVGTVAAIALATVLAFTLGRGNGGPEKTTASPTPSASPTASSPTVEPVTEAEMTAFVEDYLSTVTRDPSTTWQRLTPAFQRESKGFGSYAGFWRTVRSATATTISANPAAMTVAYDVDYVMRSGDRRSDSVTLRLTREGSDLLIAGES